MSTKTVGIYYQGYLIWRDPCCWVLRHQWGNQRGEYTARRFMTLTAAKAFADLHPQAEAQ